MCACGVTVSRTSHHQLSRPPLDSGFILGVCFADATALDELPGNDARVNLEMKKLQQERAQLAAQREYLFSSLG